MLKLDDHTSWLALGSALNLCKAQGKVGATGNLLQDESYKFEAEPRDHLDHLDDSKGNHMPNGSDAKHEARVSQELFLHLALYLRIGGLVV